MIANLLEHLRDHILALPTLAKFGLLLAAIVAVPAFCRRSRIPEMVGFLLCGVLLGPHGLGFFGEVRPVSNFFAELGQLLLMFSAGLDISIDLFRKSQKRSITFGLVTTLTPLALGTLYGLAFGYPMIPAIVIGSLLASHTLLSIPIVNRIGVMGFEPVVITMGATVVSDTLSLIVFSICVSMYTTGFSVAGLATQIAEIAIFVPVLFGVSRAGAFVLDKVRQSDEASFVAMLCVMALAGLLADLVNLPGIVGAFLAGLSVNAAVRHSPAKDKLEFFGRALFIPSFFFVTGFLIDPTAFFRSLFDHFPLVAGIVSTLLVGKGIAAAVVGRALGYTLNARLTMWALTLPQVAATLAATLVAYNTREASGQRLLDATMLNAVLVLMLVTSTIGPVLTELFAPRMLADGAGAKVATAKA